MFEKLIKNKKTKKAKSTVFILLSAAGVYHIFSVFDAAFIRGRHLLDGGVFFFWSKSHVLNNALIIITINRLLIVCKTKMF